MQENGKSRDHESDPAHNIDLGHEWGDEGGASHLGPATHLGSGRTEHPETEVEEEARDSDADGDSDGDSDQ